MRNPIRLLERQEEKRIKRLLKRRVNRLEKRPGDTGQPQEQTRPQDAQPKPTKTRSLSVKCSDPSSLGIESNTDTEISFVSEPEKQNEVKDKNPKIKNMENLRIMQWNMQRCTITELERVAK